MALASGCEQPPEEFLFVNDTSATIEVSLGGAPQGTLGNGKISPGESFRYASRPVALHGEKWSAKIDDEEQFQYIMRDGVVIVDAGGRRRSFDAKALRAQMTYAAPRQFTMHIRPNLFEPSR